MKLAVLFPGQGSQKVGMGLDLYENHDGTKVLFQKVNQIIGRDISQVFLHGPENELNQTKNTQVSIVTVSVALTMLLKEQFKKRSVEFAPIACCGHSLGELTALWFTNIISFEDLIQLVSIRGELMQTAPSGGMAAVINLQLEQVENLINNRFKGRLVIANYNSPNQYVVSGEKEVFEKLPEEIKSIGGKAIILPVSGAFHSPLMKKPAESFISEINKLNLLSETTSPIPIFQNCDGSPNNKYKTIIEKIKKQMTSPVYWTQTINNLVNYGVTNFVEIGPGKILTGLVKKINSDLVCHNISDFNSLNTFVETYEHGLSTTRSSS